ncbi:hypothetical protein Acid345_0846 [Candidatus Koribacter versatilis Ellin345]|uniref:Uncharacterized protein n=1 Tax=Koribacter versatilis (strain Ellin345) TaxID=204669 RepID=Q1ITE9_KORVE|nr:hypothetical protein [Candidatus Koribacter versatilis]ABF39851.1 hypothetical protein Acid345_0846 [Candidatus Koribacter versatilis Ellin345]
MSYATFKGDKSLKDLVTRLFTLPDKTAQTAKQAQDALLQANPQLKDLTTVPAGSVISIPANAPPLRASEQASPAISRQAAIAGQSQASLFQLGEKLEALNAVAVPAYQNFLTLVQSEQAKALAQKSPDLKEQLPTLVKSAEALGKSLQTQKTSDAIAAFKIQGSAIPS